jgi:hypothetical protein
MEFPNTHWRHLHRMTSYRFHCDILIRYNDPYTQPRVIYTFVNNYVIEPKDKFTYRPTYIDRQRRYLLEISRRN